MCKEEGQNWPDSYERKSSWRSHLEGIFFLLLLFKSMTHVPTVCKLLGIQRQGKFLLMRNLEQQK